jgi:hypothetical protein
MAYLSVLGPSKEGGGDEFMDKSNLIAPGQKPRAASDNPLCTPPRHAAADY